MTPQISEAISALDHSTTTAQSIYIAAGSYNEQVYILPLESALNIYGQTTDTRTYTSNTVTITHAITYAAAGSIDDLTATVRNHSPNTAFYNINIANTAGAAGAQALALSASATNQGYYGCQLSGFQDTLLTETGKQVYAKTEITGAIDFIFGQTSFAWFDQVDLRVPSTTLGYLTANGASSADASFYVFNNCTVTAAEGATVPSGAIYLGRPWGAYAGVMFQMSSLSTIINGAAWSKWSNSASVPDKVVFEEYDNSGAGSAGTRASFATKASEPVVITTILGSDYARWVDVTYLS